MKKTLIWVGIILAIFAVGGGVWWAVARSRKEDAAPPPPPPPPVIDADNSIPGGQQYGAALTEGAPKPPPAGTTPLPAHAPQVVQAIAIRSKALEENPTKLAIIKAEYGVGANLFDGIPNAQSDVIKSNFAEWVTNLNKERLSSYPYFGKFSSKPALLTELRQFVAAYAGGVIYSAASKVDKMNNASGTEEAPGWLGSIGYNIVTGARSKDFSEAGITYFLKANGLKSGQSIGTTIVTFAKNWANEIERLNEAIKDVAIKQLIHDGWAIEGYTVPNTTL